MHKSALIFFHFLVWSFEYRTSRCYRTLWNRQIDPTMLSACHLEATGFTCTPMHFGQNRPLKRRVLTLTFEMKVYTFLLFHGMNVKRWENIASIQVTGWVKVIVWSMWGSENAVNGHYSTTFVKCGFFSHWTSDLCWHEAPYLFWFQT